MTPKPQIFFARKTELGFGAKRERKRTGPFAPPREADLGDLSEEIDSHVEQLLGVGDGKVYVIGRIIRHFRDFFCDLSHREAPDSGKESKGER